MAKRDELEQLLRAGREGLGVEFKVSMSWSESTTQGKVIRAALALANKRDGGIIAFGLEQPEGQPLHQLIGMSQGDHDSFDPDGIAAIVNSHATPHIDLSLEHLTIDGKRFVVIDVREFTDFPVICSRDFVVAGRQVVIRGKLYCRSRRMAESTEVQSPEDMRDILDLATAKALERYFKQREIERRAVGADASEQFKSQLGDLGV
jgi:predicted HTH transcriptional regulator